MVRTGTRAGGDVYCGQALRTLSHGDMVMDAKEVAAKWKLVEAQRQKMVEDVDREEHARRVFCWWLLAAAMVLVVGRVLLTIVYWGR